MNFSPLNIVRFPLKPITAALLLVCVSNEAFSAPGELSDVPLYSRGSAEPNLMFVLDSSGSMEAMVLPADGYDTSDAAGSSCSSPMSMQYTYTDSCGGGGHGHGGGGTCSYTGTYDEVEYRVDSSDGSVTIKLVDTDNNDDTSWFTWNSSNNCFDEDEDYTAWLYAADDSGSSYYSTGEDSSNYRESVTGHFLNWFFSKENSSGGYEADEFTDDDGDAARSKVDIRRTDIMISAAQELVTGLDDVRVGLMQFNSRNGARLLFGLESLTDDNRDSILDIIEDIDASGNTPLAESFAGVGRYFITGYEENNLTYTDADGSEEEVAGEEIFAGETSGGSTSTILDWNGVSEPDDTVDGGAIQYYCQNSFMVALTDGEPTRDDSISSHLQGYDDGSCSSNTGGCTDDEMDDVVKALYDIDLRPDLTKTDGEEVVNNITSYIIGFAEDGLSDTDLMKNAGELGGGGVYTASNADQLQTTFNTIINNVQSIVGSSSSVSFNTSSLEANSAIFSASFDSSAWSGDLEVWALDDEGNIASTSSWQASTELASISTGNRVMLSYSGGVGVAFTASGLGTSGTDHADDLNLDIQSNAGVDDGGASDRIDYLRGDQTDEGTGTGDFRVRESRLGDIVSSTPVYVGAPSSSWGEAEFSEASTYDSFVSSNSSRTPVVYVGANDGFLHGFNANVSGTDAGKELIAYSPAALLSTSADEGLHALSSQYYTHKYYVDGTPTTSDAYIDGSWETVLVGGLGGGGKGYYALNITNPSDFTEANAANIVLWEFTDSDNSNLGYSFSRPQVGRMSNGEWAAIFGNGYNSSTGDAGLFIVYLDGEDGSGNSHVYISTGTADTDDKNGMSTPAIVDSDLDGTIDRIYAGDLKGNMWAFDVSATGSWDVASSTTSPSPLFSVSGEAITGAPLVARNTDNSSGASPNLLVAFGTGQYLVDSDTSDTDPGGFYVVSDNDVFNLDTDNLEERTLTSEVLTLDDGSTTTLRTVSGSEFTWSDKSGWYMPLQEGSTASQDGGERVITRPELQNYVLFFNTLIPTGQVCAAGGYGWLMSVDVWTGLAPEDSVFDANNDGVIDEDDYGYVGEMLSESSPNESGFLGTKQYTGTSDGEVHEREVDFGDGDRAGRLSWEEITPN
ncbi:PilC/PilY family type IV pilus protein [Microbulbifer sp. TRSA001]|uniref:PilC/PilY family type IV pilus protein n=1 Tax=Microbulbifer sp. TRSA001 TaxID=3243381 RepID=UPI0040398DAD